MTVSLRNYFAAHAPSQPQSWFTPTMELNEPVEPILKPSVMLVSTDFLRKFRKFGFDDDFIIKIYGEGVNNTEKLKEWVDRGIIDTDTADFLVMKWEWCQEKEEYDKEYEKQYFLQWPFAWADHMVELSRMGDFSGAT